MKMGYRRQKDDRRSFIEKERIHTFQRVSFGRYLDGTAFAQKSENRPEDELLRSVQGRVVNRQRGFERYRPFVDVKSQRDRRRLLRRLKKR